MRIFYNQKLVNDFNELLKDPSVGTLFDLWPKDEVYLKSSIEMKILNKPFGSISIVYGPRQIGKTASLKLYLTQVTDSETLSYTDCSTILNKADLYSHLKAIISGLTTIVLDEVQEVEDWHLALRSLYSEGLLKNCRILCTGSEAKYLLESGERLPGRKGEGGNIFVRPWSFREYMDFFYEQQTLHYRSINFKHVNQLWLDSQNLDWSKPWSEYLITGGFPRVIAEYRKNKTISDLVYRIYLDWILGTWSVLRTSERSLSALALRLCETMNSRVSYESLKKGTDIQSSNTVKTLMDLQEDHFAIRVLPKQDISTKKFLPAKLKKIYPCDVFIARVWLAIGKNIRRLYEENLSNSSLSLKLDECAFLQQTYRRDDPIEVSYLYSDTQKTEIDFYFDSCGFELKSNGRPTPKQLQLLKQCEQGFFVNTKTLPLMAYLIGEQRKI